MVSHRGGGDPIIEELPKKYILGICEKDQESSRVVSKLDAAIVDFESKTKILPPPLFFTPSIEMVVTFVGGDGGSYFRILHGFEPFLGVPQTFVHRHVRGKLWDQSLFQV